MTKKDEFYFVMGIPMSLVFVGMSVLFFLCFFGSNQDPLMGFGLLVSLGLVAMYSFGFMTACENRAREKHDKYVAKNPCVPRKAVNMDAIMKSCIPKKSLFKVVMLHTFQRPKSNNYYRRQAEREIRLSA